MSQERNIKWLNNRRVIYRQYPVEDVPTINNDKYMFFENGTREFYSLFNTKAKITTYRSLKWHMLVLYYLNQDGIDNDIVSLEDDMRSIFNFIANKKNSFVTFFISNKVLNNMINDVLKTGGNPPKNKIRKVIFKDYSMLTIHKKLKIVGKLIGRSSSIDEKDIYECMLNINDSGAQISIQYIADLLSVSKRTVYRHISDDLKQEIKNLNEKI